MNPLLIEVLQWLQQNHYRRASFDRLVGIVPSAATYEQLEQLVANNGDVFRSAIIKGGLPGLALHDHVDIARIMQQAYAPPPVIQDFGGVIGINEGPTITLVEDDEPVAVAPTVTATAVDAEIATEHYRNLGGALKLTGAPANNVTLCVLTLKNGFVVIGKSSCVYAENFNEDVGRKLAREDAIKQVWPYLGFRLADQRAA